MEAILQRISRVRFVEIDKRVLNFLSSMRLAISLFIILAIGSSLGTVIEQGREPGFYVAQYGATTAGWLQTFRLTDMYHSFWFLSLLGLLAVNSVTCLVRRFPGFWQSLKKKKTEFSATFVRQFHNHQDWVTARSSEETADRFITQLKSRRYKISKVVMKDGLCLFAQKGLMGRIGAHVSHVSFLLILCGGIVGSLFGTKGYETIVEGDTQQVAQAGFAIHVNRFWVDYYEDGRPKGYFSDLTIVDQGRPVLRKTIRVNDPLEYKGYMVYQTSYGEAWNRVQKAEILVRDRENRNILGRTTLDWGKETRLDPPGISMALTGYVSDFAFDIENRKVYSRSDKPNNPAVRLAVHRSDGLNDNPWIFARYPDMVLNPSSQYVYEIADVVPAKYTGLRIARDPGVPLVWVGCTLLAGGLFLSSFLFHRRLWIKIVPREGESHVYVGGTTNKNHYGLQREVQSLIHGVRS